jgi:alpha-1,2-mannosyltransferase
MKYIFQALGNYKFFVLFIFLNTVAVFMNHIDDTDETYGYWEPLHYILYNKGMQTWEYSPIYAIRSYAFIYPFAMIAMMFKNFFGIEKIPLFYTLRFIFALLASYSQHRFLSSLTIRYERLKNNKSTRILLAFTSIFLLLSPGVFYASTSYLPSAIAMSLFMLTLSSWLEGYYPEGILWGCVAVLGKSYMIVYRVGSRKYSFEFL